MDAGTFSLAGAVEIRSGSSANSLPGVRGRGREAHRWALELLGEARACPSCVNGSGRTGARVSARTSTPPSAHAVTLTAAPCAPSLTGSSPSRGRCSGPKPSTDPITRESPVQPDSLYHRQPLDNRVGSPFADAVASAASFRACRHSIPLLMDRAICANESSLGSGVLTSAGHSGRDGGSVAGGRSASESTQDRWDIHSRARFDAPLGALSIPAGKGTNGRKPLWTLAL